MVGIDAPAALAFGGERFAQGLAVPRDDFGRGVCVQVEEALRHRAVPRPARQRDRRPREDDPDRPAAEPPHGCTVTTAEPGRPKTSGSYISSTWVGAVRKGPEGVARATYGNRCSPSEWRAGDRGAPAACA